MSKQSKRDELDEEYGKEMVKKIFRITITHKNNEVVTRDFAADICIDYDNIEHELEVSPAEYVFYSSLLARQKLNVDVLKQQIIVQSAKVRRVHSNAAAAGNIKVTKYNLDSMVESDPKIIELQMKLILEEEKCGKLFGIVKGLEMKSNNLRTLAGFAKIELQNS